MSDWKIRTPETLSDLDQVVRETGLSPITVQVCFNRGLKDAKDIQSFLSPKIEDLKNPFTIKDLSKGVDRVLQARTKNETVLIFGDYDVDGTTGTSLLALFFKEFKLNILCRQPDRFKEGYGLSEKAVEEAHLQAVNLIVTIDCGITSFQAIEKANAYGIDVVVIDHHQIDAIKGIPPAFAVIDPQRSDCESGLRELCGCGLGFYFIRGMRQKARELQLFKPGEEPNLKQHLDLVVMATAADMVPLTGDNHILVRHGFQVLKNSKKPGVMRLLQSAGLVSREFTTSSLGFVIGPRINASGRMSSASIALELLTTDDSSRAVTLADQIERLNAERAEVQNQIWDQVRAHIESEIKQGKFNHGIVVAHADWHEGVVGIVASRVTEHFKKPAAVISLREDFGKGSVRSYGGKDILQALRESAHVLLGFGGHKHAAGLSVALENVDALAENFDRALANQTEQKQARTVWFDLECELATLDFKTFRELELLGPFGPGNPEPVFKIKGQAFGAKILKERHLKFQIQKMDAIWFNGAEVEEQSRTVRKSEWAEWVVIPEINRFRGQLTPTLRVKGMRNGAPRGIEESSRTESSALW